MKDSVAGIDYRFEDPRLLEEALTHRSIGSGNNERLEFLGDSVLGMVISSRLFELHPRASEGDLTKMRARLVRGTTLAKIAREMDLGRQIMMEPGVMKSGGFRNTSILADSFEALLGAIYLDGGFEACRQVIHERFARLIEELPSVDQLKDPKTRLQEWLQGRGRPLPVYSLEFEEGAAHAKTFHVSCALEDGMISEAQGSSRSAAEQAAAEKILKQLVTAGG
ncbi:MAG: ribonuclease III [Xanthomonadales bacterium]|nr:ribonuclease III [Xanthomonadales bacterium]